MLLEFLATDIVIVDVTVDATIILSIDVTFGAAGVAVQAGTSAIFYRTSGKRRAAVRTACTLLATTLRRVGDRGLIP